MKFTYFSLLEKHGDVLCVQTPSFIDDKPFNIALHTGDEANNVIKNRELVAKTLGFKLEDMCVGEQTHDCNVAHVTKGDVGRGSSDQKSAFSQTDAMMTNEKGAFLMSMTADCVAIGFYDPINKAIAVAHSGWKGTAKSIAVATIKQMQEEFNSKPQELIVVMGAAIKGCCYEVGADVVSQISKTIPKESHSKVFRQLENGKTSLDLHEVIKEQLLNEGVKASNIEIVEKCTCCSDEFFSYRRDASCGRFGLILGMRQSPN